MYLGLVTTCKYFIPHLSPSRQYLKGTHVFVHLNLCIALFLGNLVFVSGIDTANDNRVGYE